MIVVFISTTLSIFSKYDYIYPSNYLLSIFQTKTEKKKFHFWLTLLHLNKLKVLFNLYNLYLYIFIHTSMYVSKPNQNTKKICIKKVQTGC